MMTLRRVLPNVLVFAALAGIAWWGHHSGWALPGIRSNTAGAASKNADWCDQHGVPESVCVECDESLLPRGKSYGWCRVHGVHECPLCHPDVAQLDATYVITDADRARAQRALEFPRQTNGEKCRQHRRRIQFESKAAAERAGVDIAVAGREAIRESIPVFGEIIYDPTRVAHLSSRTTGRVHRVYKHLGDPVQEGEVLALIDSAEVGRAKAEFMQATVQLDVKLKALARVRNLVQTGLNTEANVLPAEAAAREARVQFLRARQQILNLGLPATRADFQLLAEERPAEVNEAELERRLQFLGIPEEVATESQRDLATSNLIALRSPLNGTIVSKDMVPGELVDGNKTILELVDTSRLWLLIDVRPDDVSLVKAGDSKVSFRPDGQSAEVEGVIKWVSTEADPKTRMVRARAELSNDQGRLRANTFGSGRILLRDEPQAVVVPANAVHFEGDCHVVFVRDKNWWDKDAPKVFHTRTVRVGYRDDNRIEIIAGVLPGEVVAAKGSEVLRAELLKGNLGEGCAHCAGK